MTNERPDLRLRSARRTASGLDAASQLFVLAALENDECMLRVAAGLATGFLGETATTDRLDPGFAALVEQEWHLLRNWTELRRMDPELTSLARLAQWVRQGAASG